jgi:hypothetical protein
MAAQGHLEWFLCAERSGRYGIRNQTIVWICGKGRDASLMFSPETRGTQMVADIQLA